MQQQAIHAVHRCNLGDPADSNLRVDLHSGQGGEGRGGEGRGGGMKATRLHLSKMTSHPFFSIWMDVHATPQKYTQGATQRIIRGKTASQQCCTGDHGALELA